MIRKVIYFFLIIVLLIGCGESSVDGNEVSEESISTQVDIPSGDDEETVSSNSSSENVVSGTEVLPNTVSFDLEEVFFQQGTLMEPFMGIIEGTDDAAMVYPSESVFCLKWDETYRMVLEIPGFEEPQYQYPMDLTVVPMYDNRNIGARLEIIAINNPLDFKDDTVIRSSEPEWTPFTDPPSEEVEQYTGNITSSVSLVLSDMPPKLVSGGSRISFQVKWEICLQPYDTVMFIYRNLMDRNDFNLFQLRTNVFAVPVKEGADYEVGIIIINSITGQRTEAWIKPPTVDDIP